MGDTVHVIIENKGDLDYFAATLAATIEAFRVSGAIRIEFVQLGGGAVLVVGHESKAEKCGFYEEDEWFFDEEDEWFFSEEDEARMESPDASDPLISLNPSIYSDAKTTPELLSRRLMTRTLSQANNLAKDPEVFAFNKAVRFGAAVSPSMLRGIHDDIAWMVERFAELQPMDDVASPSVLVLLAMLDGLRLFDIPSFS